MNKSKQIGIPYMGSKRKFASKIVDEILSRHPHCEYVYDLFGGGGAITFEFLQRNQIKQVFYNEFNTGITELLTDIRDNGITDKYYQWIDRKTFFENKDKDDWLGGFCKAIWSFGNNQKSYIFGKDIEPLKRLGHKIVVNKCETSRLELSEILGVEVYDANQ